MWEVLDHPFVLILLTVVAFFFRDLFFKIQDSTSNKTEITLLKERVTKLEAGTEVGELQKSVIRLEEQVKNLADKIEFLLDMTRGHNDKNHSS